MQIWKMHEKSPFLMQIIFDFYAHFEGTSVICFNNFSFFILSLLITLNFLFFVIFYIIII